MDTDNHEDMSEYRKSGKVSGSLADTIITTLIDNCPNEGGAAAFGVSIDEWCKLVQAFEEQVRHVVRDIR